MAEPADDAAHTYIHGHRPSILADHAGRSSADSATFMTHLLASGTVLLDVGCGPGTITCDLADLVAPTQLIGIDSATDAIEHARGQAAERGVTNVRFEAGDVYNLRFDDATFDVVYAHQVLQHLDRPVEALIEMRRVSRPGGTVAVRDADYATMVHAPHDDRMDRWLALYREVAVRSGGQPDAGRYLSQWLDAAGFVDIVTTTSTWTYTDDETRGRWRDLWVSRLLEARLGRLAEEHGLIDRPGLEDLAHAWRRWADAPQAFFAFLHGEAIGTVPV